MHFFVLKICTYQKKAVPLQRKQKNNYYRELFCQLKKNTYLRGKIKHRNYMDKLNVYYGWAKVTKIMKKESLMVIYTNDIAGPRIGKDGNDGVSRFMNIAYKRDQTEKEKEDSKHQNRIYTCYEIYMDSPNIKGSLEAALYANYKADEKNVRKNEREKIKDVLKKMYLETHPGYKEPVRQLEIF